MKNAIQDLLDNNNITVQGVLVNKRTRSVKLTLYMEGDSDKRYIDNIKSGLSEQYNLRECVVEIVNPHEEKQQTAAAPAKKSGAIYGKEFKATFADISSVDEESGRVAVSGNCFYVETREMRGGNYIFRFDITDFDNSITCKMVGIDKKTYDSVSARIKPGVDLCVRGLAQDDKYSREVVLMANDIYAEDKPKRMDNAEVKRVELHLHTQMSSMDGVTPAADLVKRAASWGHSAVAITDHGVVQAFPDASMAVPKGSSMKIIYGMEGYLVNNKLPPVKNSNKKAIYSDIVVFDIETTGFNATHDKITEIGAVRLTEGKITETFSELINPEMQLPQKIVQLTGITDEMLADKETIDKVLPRFMEFVGDAALVAHNASFDTGFIAAKLNQLGMPPLECAIVDTVQLSRCILPDLKRHSLDAVAKHLKITNAEHHRAHNDAEVAAAIYLYCVEQLSQRGAKTLDDVNNLLKNEGSSKNERMYHVTLLAKNNEGLKNLYRLVSASHLDHFYKKPRIPKELLTSHREGLLIGTACESGELYTAYITGKSESELEEIAKYYDYLEIQPLCNNNFLVRKGTVPNVERLIEINKAIYNLGKKLGKIVIAASDVHFLDPHDAIYRKALMKGQGFSDADDQADLYLRTTEEMLAEFIHMGEDIAYEVVVTNTNKIAEMCEPIAPLPKGTFPPVMENAADEVIRLSNEKAHAIYGDPLPEIVEQRMNKELKAITTYGFSVMYYIAHKLVTKSNSDGYLVGSRGSVGSSLIAFLCDITEVNSLPPHYVCPSCKHSIFENEDGFPTDRQYGCGVDMPPKPCPKCGTQLKKDGHDIPFETFLGFEGDKEPDIDLNFSGEYQSRAHKYTETLLGEKNVFRAGTISTLASKTAYGFIKKYAEESGRRISAAEINRLVQGCIGIKRTTGQHPGGLMVLPKGHDIHEFCPIQYPSDDSGKGVVTTHFDYHSLHGKLLKLDILGHDDPSMIRMLVDLTDGKVDPQQIDLGDPETMSLFTSTKALGVTEQDIGSEVGTFGVPEFGTKFVRQMLKDTTPRTFAELVYISGLSHGTDVWLGNAQELIQKKITDLNGVISTRDDIMTYLVRKNLPPYDAFDIMEKVRKGKGLTSEQEALMRQYNVPNWYIDSCKKIKYMFPKAHAVAYVTMAFRIAYFKVHHPKEYYIAHFTIRADEFDAEIMCGGFDKAMHKRREIEQMGNDANQKDKNMLGILEMVCEMYKRGINFVPIDLYKSDAKRFQSVDGGIMPPLAALPGLGENAALSIVAARNEGSFSSIDDLRIRTKVSKTVIEMLQRQGCLKGLPESNQMSIFDMLA